MTHDAQMAIAIQQARGETMRALRLGSIRQVLSYGLTLLALLPTSGCGDDTSLVAPSDRVDLVVGSPAVTPLKVDRGAPVILSGAVRNQGSSPSAATTLRYYHSSDVTISTADTELGIAAVAALAPGASAAHSVWGAAPGSAGTHYFGVCVDAVSGESNTTNNCSDAVEVAVTARAPDLTVQSASVYSSTVAGGLTLTLYAAVHNQGDGYAVATTTLRYYRSTDATISTADTQVGADAVAALAAGASVSRSENLTAPATPGTYYFGACVDAVSGEADTTNNCSAAVSVTVVEEPAAEPDLSVASLALSDSRPAPAAAFSLNATVSNQGEGASSATTLRYYRSTDATISSSDTELATAAVPALRGGASWSRDEGLTAPASAGTYYFGACVDAVSGEADTTNNCSAAVSLEVGDGMTAAAPDLIVTSLSRSFHLFAAYFKLNATVSNQGEGASSATTLRYYRSTDATISTADTQVGTDAVAALDAGASSSESGPLTAPASAGTYYFGACVDAVSGEADTTNNCSASLSLTVAAADLSVGSLAVSDSRRGWGLSAQCRL